MENNNMALMQQLFSLMGKAVRVHLADGRTEEGFIRGVLLEGAQMSTFSGDITIPFEEIQKIDGFDMPAPVQEEVQEGEGIEFFLSALRESTKEEFGEKLKDDTFCARALLRPEQAKSMSARLVKMPGNWDASSTQVASRYRSLLKTEADPEVLVRLYTEALGESGANNGAVLELLRLYVKLGQSEKAIELFRAHEEEIGGNFNHMQMYAVAIGQTEGAAAMRKYLRAHPDLVDYSTFRSYFDKILKDLEEDAISGILNTLLQDGIFAAPNTFESEILTGTVQRARQLVKNETEMRNMGYTHMSTMEEILREPQVEDMEKKELWQRACILQRLEGNKNRVAERVLLEEGKEAGARAALLLLYGKEKAHKKVLMLYDTLSEIAFNQMVAAAVAYGAEGRTEDCAALLEEAPELLADPAVREMLISSPEGTYKETEIARSLSEEAYPPEGTNPFEKALIEGNAEAISAFARDAEALEEMNYSEEEREKISAAAESPYPLVKNDMSAARRIRLFLGDKGLLAVQYLCRYATEANTGEILSLMAASGLRAWGDLFFASRREFCIKNAACCTAYAALVLKTSPAEEALSIIRPFLENIYDRPVLQRVRAACLEAGETELGDKIGAALEAYEPNAFEAAIVSGEPLEAMATDTKFLESLGYTEEEIETVQSGWKNAPKGKDEGSIGLRLYGIQKNKNGLAELHMAKHETESPAVARQMMHIYVDSERFEEAVSLFEAVPKFFGSNTPEYALSMHALYQTGRYARFIAEYFKNGVTTKKLTVKCIVCLLSEGDARAEELLCELAPALIFKQVEKSVWQTLLILLKEKGMERHLARILLELLDAAVEKGNFESFLSLAETVAVTEEEKARILAYATEENLPMVLPAFWVTREPGHEKAEIAEAWCEQALKRTEVVSEGTAKNIFSVLDMLFPQKKAELSVQKVIRFVKNEETLGEVLKILEAALADKEYDVLLGALPHLAPVAVQEEVLSLLEKIMAEDMLCEEIILLLAGCVREQASEALCTFFAEKVDVSKHKDFLDESVLLEIKEGLMAYAATRKEESTLGALYTFLESIGDGDAPILACFMINNNRIWSSYESRNGFEEMVVAEEGALARAVSSAFSEALTSVRPEAISSFFEKWYPFTAGREEEAAKALARLGKGGAEAGDNAEFICSMAAACHSVAAWRQLLDIYRYKGISASGNMLYSIAKYSENPRDLQALFRFAKENELPLLYTSGALLRMKKEKNIELSVKHGCKDLVSLVKSAVEIPRDLALDFYAALQETLEAKAVDREDILSAGRQLAFACRMAGEYATLFEDKLAVTQKELVAFVLEIFLYHPEEWELGDTMRTLLAASEGTFSAKQFTLDITQEPELLQEKGKSRAAAEALLAFGVSVNVQRMTAYIIKVMTDPAPEALDVALSAIGVLLPYFRQDGLYHACRYFLLSAKGDPADAAETYKELYNYLSKTYVGGLFLQYTRQLFCGLYYLQEKGILIEDAPGTEEELRDFVNTVHVTEEKRAELEDFLHMVPLLHFNNIDGGAVLFESLLYAGLTANWRDFICAFEQAKTEKRQNGDIETFIFGIGRFGFLRGIAGTIACDGSWEKAKDLLTEEEELQIEAMAIAPYTAEERELAKQITRCTLLNKEGKGNLCNAVADRLTPTQFGTILPLMRVMVTDGILMEKCRQLGAEYLQEATKTVVRQKEQLPAQVYGKVYRKFLRNFANVLFDAGLYREAGPIFKWLHDTEQAATAHDEENRVTDMTYRVSRQREKFCAFIVEDKEMVQEFRTATEPHKVVNFFAGHFSSPRSEDIAKVAHIFTPMQKKVGAAVYFASLDNFTEFESFASAVQAESKEMGEVLFRYGAWRFTEEADKEKCRRHYPFTVEEPTYRFYSPRPFDGLGKINILEALGIVEEGGSFEKDTAQKFTDGEIARYVLTKYKDIRKEESYKDVQSRFEATPLVELGAAVLQAADFSEGLSDLQPFYGRLSVFAYAEARNEDVSKAEAMIPEMVQNLAVLEAVQTDTANLLCSLLSNILGEIIDAETYKAYFGAKVGKLIRLLSAADAPDAEYAKRGIKTYFETVERILEIRKIQTEEKKIEEISALQKKTAKTVQSLRREAEDYTKVSAEETKKGSRLYSENTEAITKAMVGLSVLLAEEKEAMMQRPLIFCRIDSLTLTAGETLTGYIENFGLENAEEVELTLTCGEEMHTLYMETLFANYKAPFSFPLPDTEESSFTLRIRYTFEDEKQPPKDLGFYTVKRVPGEAIQYKPVSENPLYVGDMDNFVGRKAEVRALEMEFYESGAKEDNTSCVPRHVKELQALVVNGPKRVGKTTFLHKIEAIAGQMPDLWAPVFFDVSNAKSLRQIFVTHFVKAFADVYGFADIQNRADYQKIEEKVSKEGPLDASELQAFYKAFRDTFAPGKKILCIIDEIEKGISVSSMDALFNLLEFLARNLQEVVGFVICGSDDLASLIFDLKGKSQFFQLAKTYKIGRMPRDEYMELLNRYDAHTEIKLSDAAREALWFLTNGQVFYTQRIFNSVKDAYAGTKIAAKRRYMYLHDVYEAYESQRGPTGMFYGLRETFKGYKTKEEEVIFKLGELAAEPESGVTPERLRSWLIPEAGEAKMTETEMQEALERLQGRGFIKLVDGAYRFTSEMYRVEFGTDLAIESLRFT